MITFSQPSLVLADLRSKLTCRVLMIDLTALYFFNNLYIVLDITSLSSATCFDVISERNKNQISEKDIMAEKSNNKLLEIFFINISHQGKDTRDEASLITLLICSRIILFHGYHNLASITHCNLVVNIKKMG